MSAVSDPTTGPAAPKLTLIQSTGPQAHAPSQDERPLLARVCAGEPIVLTSHEADFTTLLNDAVTDDLVVLDPDLDFLKGSR